MRYGEIPCGGPAKSSLKPPGGASHSWTGCLRQSILRPRRWPAQVYDACRASTLSKSRDDAIGGGIGIGLAWKRLHILPSLHWRALDHALADRDARCDLRSVKLLHLWRKLRADLLLRLWISLPLCLIFRQLRGNGRVACRVGRR